ncbi:MAG: XRE family transcriptional regulator [Fusobacteriaceae bacterium]
MEKLSITVKKFRETRGITQLQLAEKAKVGSGTIGEIESGKRRCTIKTLDKIAVALNLTKEEKNILDNSFMGRALSTISQSNTKSLTNDDFIKLQVRAKTSAGNGYVNFENISYPKIIRKGNYNKECYLIEVVGDSMEPLILDGSFVIVDSLQIEYVPNKIYIVCFKDEIFIKRVLINEEAKVMILKSVNTNYEDMYIIGKDMQNVKLLGKAIKFIYEGNL